METPRSRWIFQLSAAPPRWALGAHEWPATSRGEECLTPETFKDRLYMKYLIKKHCILHAHNVSVHIQCIYIYRERELISP